MYSKQKTVIGVAVFSVLAATSFYAGASSVHAQGGAATKTVPLKVTGAGPVKAPAGKPASTGAAATAAASAPGAASGAPAGAPGTKPLDGAVQHVETAHSASKEELLKGTAGIIAKSRGGWNMFLQNPCRTANLPLPAADWKGKLKWTFPAEGPIDSSPAIYKGVIYVGSDDANLYAINERNGSMLWRATLGGKVKSSPAVTDSIIVVGCEDQYVYGLIPSTGQVKWKVRTNDRVSSSPALYDGIAYFGGWDGQVYAVNVDSGSIKWVYPGPAPDQVDTGAGIAKPGAGIGRITGSPALAPGMVLVASQEGYVYALNSNDGKVIWRYKTSGKILGSPMIMDGTVYIGSWDKNLYALDLASGATRWKFAGQESFSIAPTGAEGKVYAGNDDHIMYCLNAASGKVLWKTTIFSPVPLLSSSPAIVGKMMYCGSPDNSVYAIDTRNGAVKWKFPTQRPIISSPAVCDSGICIGSQDGNLYLIN